MIQLIKWQYLWLHSQVLVYTCIYITSFLKWAGDRWMDRYLLRNVSYSKQNAETIYKQIRHPSSPHKTTSNSELLTYTYCDFMQFLCHFPTYTSSDKRMKVKLAQGENHHFFLQTFVVGKTQDIFKAQCKLNTEKGRYLRTEVENRWHK